MTNDNFSKILRAAWERSLTMTNITACFQAMRVYTFDCSAVDLRGYHAVPEKCLSLTQRTGL